MDVRCRWYCQLVEDPTMPLKLLNFIRLSVELHKIAKFNSKIVIYGTLVQLLF